MEDTDSRQAYAGVCDEHIVGFVIFTIAFIGMIANGTVAIFTSKLSTMNNAYGRLAASQSTAETVLCAVFCFYYTPMIVFKSSMMEYYSYHAGWINLICYDICIWSHLFIALNRLVAICFPLRYKLIFRSLHTRLMITTSWVISIITAVVLFKLHDCDFFFSSETWAFVFPQTEICNFISWKIDFFKDLSIVVVISVVDTIAIISILHSKHQVIERKTEINFLKQLPKYVKTVKVEAEGIQTQCIQCEIGTVFVAKTLVPIEADWNRTLYIADCIFEYVFNKI